MFFIWSLLATAAELFTFSVQKTLKNWAKHAVNNIDIVYEINSVNK